MDEYTFLVLAKLKADRFKLEREALATLPQPERPEGRNNRPEYFRHTRRAARKFEWSEQS